MITDKVGGSSAKPEAWIELGLVENYRCLKYVEKCLRKNFPCLGKAQCLRKDRYHLRGPGSTWRTANTWRLTTMHIFQHLLDLAGAQVYAWKIKCCEACSMKRKQLLWKRWEFIVHDILRSWQLIVTLKCVSFQCDKNLSWHLRN